eukprot:1074754-Amphidinium_carterae.1
MDWTDLCKGLREHQRHVFCLRQALDKLVKLGSWRAHLSSCIQEMVAVGMKPESAYYESLHETPLIANTVQSIVA